MGTDKFTILHTADWHLGKKLFKESRQQEHQFFLQWLLQTGKELCPDVLIIAGDVFDSPIPSTEALKLYFDFLKQWSTELPLSNVIIVAGNHDSGRFLEAPQSWLQEHRIAVYGSVNDTTPLTLHKNDQPITFYPFAYFRTNEIYKKLKEQLPTFDSERWEEDDDYVLELLHHIFTPLETGKHILIAHHAFGQFSSGESEQAISFAGKQSIPTSVFKQHFDYVALGHIHKLQKISSEPPAYYSGSPIPFRFSESNDKFLLQATINLQTSKIQIKQIPIPLLKELHTLKVNAQNYSIKLKTFVQDYGQQKKEILLLLVVDLDHPLPTLYNEVIEIVKDTNIRILNIQTFFTPVENITTNDREKTEIIYSGDIHRAFKLFYEEKTGQTEIPNDIKKEFDQLLEAIRNPGQETT